MDPELRRRLDEVAGYPHRTPLLADWAKALADEDAAITSRRLPWRLRIEVAAIAACFLAGVWWDLRMIPTALIPLAVLIFDGCKATALDWRTTPHDPTGPEDPARPGGTPR